MTINASLKITMERYLQKLAGGTLGAGRGAGSLYRYQQETAGLPLPARQQAASAEPRDLCLENKTLY